MKKALLSTTLLIASCFGQLAHAGLEESSKAMCDKFRQCAYKEMEKQTVTPEMRGMMEGMLDQMCATFTSNTQDVNAIPALEDKAQACFDSILAMPCESLTGMETNTPACDALEKAAEKYGLN